jgi:hypothetical protein
LCEIRVEEERREDPEWEKEVGDEGVWQQG